MSGLEIVCFIAMAILCNTVLPIPFDPVLIAFASSQPNANAVAIALAGAICVTLGRAPRYLLTILLWPTLGLPRGSGLVLLALAVMFGMIGWLRQPSRRLNE